MYLIHIETRIWSPLIRIYSKKCFFGPQNIVVSLKHMGKKSFFPTLIVIILQMVRNECVRFGGHVEV
jgi:hypothetical protein